MMGATTGIPIDFLLSVAVPLALLGLLRLPGVKGGIGEIQAALAHRLFLDQDVYATLDDVVLPTANGSTQIDHVVVSRYGIFVVESKNMRGWIFGDEKRPQWTQSLYGRRYRFENPLHQTHRHVRALAELLKLDDAKFHSVVMFWGSASFKAPMPPNVLNRGYGRYIKSKREVVFSEDEVMRYIVEIHSAMLPRDRATRRLHVESLAAWFGSTTTCPKCACARVPRMVQAGAGAGPQVLQCPRFPACGDRPELAGLHGWGGRTDPRDEVGDGARGAAGGASAPAPAAAAGHEA